MKMTKLLKYREVEWLMNSREIWLELDDENKKVFCHFSNHWENINTIWELCNCKGRNIWRFKNLVDLWV